MRFGNIAVRLLAAEAVRQRALDLILWLSFESAYRTMECALPLKRSWHQVDSEWDVCKRLQGIHDGALLSLAESKKCVHLWFSIRRMWAIGKGASNLEMDHQVGSIGQAGDHLVKWSWCCQYSEANSIGGWCWLSYLGAKARKIQHGHQGLLQEI